MEQALPDDVAAIWQRVSDEVRASLPRSTYRLWLEPLRPVSAHGSTLYVTGPRQVRAWVERRYAPRLERVLRDQTHSLREIVLVSSARDAPSPDRDGAPPQLRPNPTHTFERFVIGASNRIAHAAALAVAEMPAEAYNPLFLHGEPGLGKTHLLGAITHYLHRNHAELTVRYTTAERFTSEFVTALRGPGAAAFKHAYRTVDVLVIDDIQFLQRKARTEEEFFHTFEALHATGSQLILAGDRAPAELSELASRLRDRFDWGLSVKLGPPDLSTRVTLLSRLVAEAPHSVEPPDTLREIAALAPTNLRQLEGALTRVLALASITGRTPDAELVREALHQPGGDSTCTATSSRQPSIVAIQDAVCAVFGLSRVDLLSPARTTRITRARHLAMYLSRELTDRSLAEIAREFRRDHSTVLHAVRRIGAELEPGSPPFEQLARARELLRASTTEPRTLDGTR